MNNYVAKYRGHSFYFKAETYFAAKLKALAFYCDELKTHGGAVDVDWA